MSDGREPAPRWAVRVTAAIVVLAIVAALWMVWAVTRLDPYVLRH